MIGETADLSAFVWKCEGTGLVAGGDQVARSTVEWNREFGTGKARARNDRLEIAGQQARVLAQTRDANGPKILFEKDARGTGILRLQVCGLAANVRQRACELPAIVAGPFTQGAATGLVGGKSREMIVGGPARELGPFDRLELTVREFQRAFSKCGGHHETCDRSEETCNRATPQGLPTRAA